MLRTKFPAMLAVTVPALLAACAAIPPDVREGTVSAVFVEPVPGILLSPDITETGAPLPRWAEVRFDAAIPGQGRTLARLPDGTDIDVGDRVVVQPAISGTAIDLPGPGIPGMKAIRPLASDARPAMVSALQSRAPRVEVSLP